MDREWSIAPVWAERERAAIQWGIDPIIAQVLHNRGIADPDNARSFLDPKLTQLGEPEDYVDLVPAARTLAQAVRAGRRIAVYSDYDVDGVCGAAILWHVLPPRA